MSSTEETTQEAPPTSLSASYTAAESLRATLDTHPSNSPAFASQLTKAIHLYATSIQLCDRLALFSPNELLDDIATSSLPYLLLHVRLAELLLRKPGGVEAGRKHTLLEARSEIESFLRQLHGYRLLGGRAQEEMWERYGEDKDGFEVMGRVDAQSRREGKIKRWKEEKELKARLEYLSRNTHVQTSDESSVRALYLASIALAVHDAFASLESIALELQVLSRAPPPTQAGAGSADDPTADVRARQKALSNYSERLDPSLASLFRNGRGAGPILDRSGRPLQPFTLLDKRSQLRQGVFRPDHNLPTMSIDEYLEEERRRGGIIEGGGEKSGIRPEVDEDDMDIADRETMKAREWDEFAEQNPKGSGNTINRG